MTQGWMLLTLFLLYHDVKDVRPESNVGCFFNPRLCDQEEICYDDNAFGRCQAGYEDGGDTYRHNLTPDTLRLLEQEMKRLFNGGYRWSNDYTQCTMQNILYTDRHNLMYDPGLCSRVLKLTLPAVPSHVAEELEHVNPQDLAYISFNPSKIDTYSDYADETYIPPIEEPRFKNVYAFDNNEDVTYQGKKDKRNNQLPDSGRNVFSELESEIFLEYLRELLQAAGETLREEENNLENSKQEPPSSRVDLLSTLKEKPIFTEGGTEWVSVEEPSIQEQPEEQLSSLLMTNPDIWKKETADKKPIFINHLNELIEKERNNKDRWKPLQRDNLISDILSPPDGSTSLNEDENMWVKNAKFLKHLNTVSESGEHINAVDNGDPEIEQDPEKRFKDEFERPMRYDAKKPGPAYYVHEPESSETGNVNDFVIPSDIMKALSIGGENSFPSLTSGVANGQHPSFSPYAVENELALKQLVTKSLSNPRLSSVSMTTDIKPEEFVFRDESEVVKTSKVGKNQTNESLAEVLPYPISTTVSTPSGHLKPVIADAIGNGGGQYEAVDSSLAYLLMDSTLTMEEGSHLAKRLEKLLSLPRGTFSNVRVKKKQVIFKVNPNPKGLNASTVARKAEELTGEIQKTMGKSVVSAGIGDEIQFEVVNKESSNHRLFILSFVLCGCVVGVLIAVAVLYVVRRHARSRQKLQNLGLPETEASQDYQDLCRQRMASKTNEKPEPGVVSQSPKRISSLSQSEASQPSPSSRSSTSSWNEEPVTSNMDISTGHMILSYMEDHLKNKDRLDREWEALCAYEAEPCSVSAASLPQNIKKNRYPDVLPYDHSRVVLNDFSNICGSDYINASTITDHDPRNPAYIATQGPLPHTAADFWQMVWEQGSVVIVMVTRLMENGVAMCHRYWPEEGSEVYHIYEVHLVSEHIWCDDYLVRSFYLKNLKTSETRTVTQFHFLSWPENGVPSSTKALLEFRRKVNKSYRGRSCPIMVHCSDGIGRTGTYCLIDMVLNRMAKGAKEIDIAATLEHIRDQRGGTVKTKAQFEFALMAVAEEVHAILKALSQ